MRIVPWVLLFSVGGAGSAAQVAFPAFNGNVGVGTTNAPYSAKQTVVRTQTAANGQKFPTTQVSLLWRDSEGRIRQEDLLKTPSGQDFRHVILMDPVACVHMSWNIGLESRPKLVIISHLPCSLKRGPPHTDPWTVGPCGNGCTREMLDPQQVNGIDARGMRQTGVTDLGTGENGQELMETNRLEMWVSPDLDIIVREISDSPRGRLVTNTTDVVPGDPALFNLPPGYPVHDTRDNAGGG